MCGGEILTFRNDIWRANIIYGTLRRGTDGRQRDAPPAGASLGRRLEAAIAAVAQAEVAGAGSQ